MDKYVVPTPWASSPCAGVPKVVQRKARFYDKEEAFWSERHSRMAESSGSPGPVIGASPSPLRASLFGAPAPSSSPIQFTYTNKQMFRYQQQQLALCSLRARLAERLAEVDDAKRSLAESRRLQLDRMLAQADSRLAKCQTQYDTYVAQIEARMEATKRHEEALLRILAGKDGEPASEADREALLAHVDDSVPQLPVVSYAPPPEADVHVQTAARQQAEADAEALRKRVAELEAAVAAARREADEREEQVRRTYEQRMATAARAVAAVSPRKGDRREDLSASLDTSTFAALRERTASTFSFAAGDGSECMTCAQSSAKFRDGYKRMLRQLKAAHEREMGARDEAHAEELERVRGEVVQLVRRAEDELRSERELLVEQQAAAEARASEAAARCERAVAEHRKQMEEELAAERAHAAERERELAHEHEFAMYQVRKDAEALATEAKREWDAERAALQHEQIQDVAAVERRMGDELRVTRADLERQVEELKEAVLVGEAELERARAAHAGELAEAREEIRLTNENHALEKEVLAAEYETALGELEKRQRAQLGELRERMGGEHARAVEQLVEQHKAHLSALQIQLSEQRATVSENESRLAAIAEANRARAARALDGATQTTPKRVARLARLSESVTFNVTLGDEDERSSVASSTASASASVQTDPVPEWTARDIVLHADPGAVPASLRAAVQHVSPVPRATIPRPSADENAAPAVAGKPRAGATTLHADAGARAASRSRSSSSASAASAASTLSSASSASASLSRRRRHPSQSDASYTSLLQDYLRQTGVP